MLVEVVMVGLNLQPDGLYVDATYGRGGHSAEILDRLGPNGRLLALDRDPQAIAAARTRLADDERFAVIPGRFSMLDQYIDKRGLTGRINGMLFDLGVSSPQLEDPKRGFGFHQRGPLDMRMEPDTGVSAARWINSAREQEIASVLFEYGDERFSRRIARAIVRERKQQPIATPAQLTNVVSNAVPTREAKLHPATRTFLAIRVFINQELEELRTVLPQATRALAAGGRLAVISFHSLEDRIVKHFMREQVRGSELPPGLPLPVEPFEPRLKIIGKPIRPSAAEIKGNPRTRSAILRIAERTEVGF
ncbi:MAG: 16S rRNA (cytosine(1402)-N(4))-methyltransferase RsmH [Acidiferrobacterales bacterium]